MEMKENIIKKIEKKYLSKFKVVERNFEKPWGAYWVIDSNMVELFVKKNFNTEIYTDLQHYFVKNQVLNLSPKILLVAPNSRLSWQYHHRRSEYWQVLEGPVGVARSMDDDQPPVEAYSSKDLITLVVGERHRLIGLDNWGVVAEIWVHANSSNLSDEDDIIRLQDDYGR